MIVETAYEVDIYPSERRCTATGHYVLDNQTDAATVLKQRKGRS